MAIVNNRRVAWVLGAGFSRSLGGPLLHDMFSRRGLEETMLRFPTLDQTGLIEVYSVYGNHLPNMGNMVLWRHAEDFLDYADTARRPGPRQDLLKRIVKFGLDEFYSLCVQAIAAENSFASDGDLSSEPWLPYVDWAKTLSSLDSVITFNYDLVLEQLGTHDEVDNLGQKTAYGVSDTATRNPRQFATIYKLHGSVDWKLPDPGQTLSRASSPRDLLVEEQPILIASPGPTKKLYREGHLVKIWERAVTELKDADAIVFCGYRFPPSDSESRRLLLQAIRDNDRPDLRIHVVLGQPDAASRPSIERLKSLLTSVLATKRREGPIIPENERQYHFEVVVHPLYVEDFFTVMNRDAITHVTYPPYKSS